MKAIVTVKLQKNLRHDPYHKVQGRCPLNPNVWCTDVTGEHHSYVESGTSLEEIAVKASTRFKHITRIECFNELPTEPQKPNITLHCP